MCGRNVGDVFSIEIVHAVAIPEAHLGDSVCVFVAVPR